MTEKEAETVPEEVAPGGLRILTRLLLVGGLLFLIPVFSQSVRIHGYIALNSLSSSEGWQTWICGRLHREGPNAWRALIPHLHERSLSEFQRHAIYSYILEHSVKGKEAMAVLLNACRTGYDTKSLMGTGWTVGASYDSEWRDDARGLLAEAANGPLLFRHVDSADPFVRACARDCLAEILDKVMRMMQEALAESSKEKRLALLEVLRITEVDCNRAIVDLVDPLLDSKDPEERRLAAYAMANIHEHSDLDDGSCYHHPDRILPILIEEMKLGEAKSVEILEIMGGFYEDNYCVIEVLLSLLDKGNAEEKEKGAWVLYRLWEFRDDPIGARSRKALEALLESKDPMTRLWAIGTLILKKVKSKKLFELLKAYVKLDIELGWEGEECLLESLGSYTDKGEVVLPLLFELEPRISSMSDSDFETAIEAFSEHVPELSAQVLKGFESHSERIHKGLIATMLACKRKLPKELLEKAKLFIESDDQEISDSVKKILKASEKK